MQAVMQQRNFASARLLRRNELSIQLARILMVTTLKEDADMPEFASSISRTIVEPAISLACDLELSEFRVDVAWTGLARKRTRRQEIPQDAYSSWVFIDTDANGKLVRLKPKSGKQDMEYSYIAEAVPGLWCARSDGIEKWIVEPQVLVKKGWVKRQEERDKLEVSVFSMLQDKIVQGRNSERE